VRTDQVTQVRGYADQMLRVKNNPTDPSNRSISILVKNEISKHIAYLVRARIVIKTKRGRESVCTLRPEAIKTVSDWAISYRRFWEESFDKLEVVVNQMKKEELRDDTKHG
jgi:hypothetical protein